MATGLDNIAVGTQQYIGLENQQPTCPPYRVQPIQVDPALNGYIVRVGCKIIVFEGKEKLLSELGRYLSDPNVVTKEYLEKYK